MDEQTLARADTRALEGDERERRSLRKILALLRQYFSPIPRLVWVHEFGIRTQSAT
jgi:hypothetical protein